ncbi:MAG: thiamine phosphate synthase [Bacillota bacterium]|nr:thiamine phosphate synthase [Bacillota bacterium]
MFRNEVFENVIAVSNRKLCTRPFLEQIELVCRHRPVALILREKDLSESEYEKLGQEVKKICETYQVTCIYHSFYEAAKKTRVKNIHLPLWKLEELNEQDGQKDFDIIGVSIHSVEEAKRAEKLGASYLTAGHIYKTGCKADLAPRGLEFLREVCQSVDIPVYAIGGIHLEGRQFAEIQEAGAKGGCVMSEFMRIS